MICNKMDLLCTANFNQDKDVLGSDEEYKTESRKKEQKSFSLKALFAFTGAPQPYTELLN